MGTPIRRPSSDSAKSLTDISAKIGNNLRKEGTYSLNENGGQMAVGFESRNAQAVAGFQTDLDKTARALALEFESYAEVAKPSMEQLFAGAMILQAMSDPVVYSKEAYGVSEMSSTDKYAVVPCDGGGSYGSYGYTSQLDTGFESFSNETLKKYGGVSVAYNIQASRQDPFCERLFRTVTVTPENGGVDVSVSSMVVMNHFLHDPKGARADFGRKLLLRAAMDAGILSDESTRIVPEWIEDETDHLFVAPDVIAPRDVVLGKRQVKTAPVKVGEVFDLLGLGSTSIMRLNGQLSSEDGLDRMVSVDEIYLQIADGDALSFSVRNLPRSLFYKAPQGADRELTLTFVSKILTLNENTVLADGSDVTNATLALIKAQKLTVALELGLDGSVNVETGNISVNARPVKVYSIHNEAKEKISLTTGAGLSVVNGLAQLAVIGYDPGARLTNANRRERGLVLTRTEYVERYPVLLGPPMIFPSPLGEERNVSDMNMLLTATRLRNNNNAITRLLNYSDDLERWMAILEDTDADNIVPEIEGIGRYYVYPWHRSEDLHLPDHIQSVKTSERIADISELLVNHLRDGIWEAYRETNIQTAMDALTGYSGKKPMVFIGTDSKLSRFIMVQGDTRTIGDGLQFEKHESPDRRVFGKIFYTFVTDGEGIDPLNFGSHIWIPELISAVNVSRSNSHYDEAMVQNRSRHIVHLPVLGVINVTGLDEVLKNQTPFPVSGQVLMVEAGAGDGADDDDAGAGGAGGAGADTGNGTAP